MATSSHTFSPRPGAEVCFEPGIEDLTSDELIRECVGGDTAAWEEFRRRFEPFIARAVARAAMCWARVSTDLIDDLVQETYLKLCAEKFRHLRRFSSHHEKAIYGFLKKIACNATTDYFRSRCAVKRGGEFFQDDDLDIALQVACEDCLEERILIQQIETFIDQITTSEQDKIIFRLRFEQGLTTKDIAEANGVCLSQKGVESCLRRLTILLKALCRKRSRHDSLPV